jgi:hypothetical protein
LLDLDLISNWLDEIYGQDEGSQGSLQPLHDPMIDFPSVLS